MSYATIKLPIAFVEKYIDPFVKKASEGFTSRADVIKSIIRDNSNIPDKKNKSEKKVSQA